MTKIGLKAGKLFLRGGWRALRLFLRRPATVIIAILFLVALVLGYRAWRAGFSAAIPALIPLALCLILIITIFLARRKIERWALTSASRGRTAAQKRIARGMVQEGIDRGEAVLERGAEAAKGAFSTLTEEVKTDWERLAAKPHPPQSQPSRCPFCGHLLRSAAKFCDHCGRRLRLTCVQCSHLLRLGANFCDHCGASVS